MSVKWTEDQQKAISTEGKGIIVSAAAGSGKTAVLIERIIRLLCDKSKNIPADRLLAVTFTNEAAAQMRDKLDKAFEKKLAEDPDNRWIMQQQELVGLARISTINSFCLDLVKDNLHLFDFQGGLKIMEPAEAAMVYDEAYSRAVDEMCGEEPEKFEQLYEAFGDKPAKLGKIIKSLYEFMRSLPFRHRWAEKAKAAYTNGGTFDALKADFLAKAEELIFQTEAKIDKLRFYYNFSITAGKTYFLRDYMSCIEKAINYGNECVSVFRKAVREGNWDGFRKASTSCGYTVTVKNLKSADSDIKLKITDLKNAVASVNSDMKDLIKEIIGMFKVPEAACRANLENACGLFDLLMELAERTERLADETKLEKNSVEFSDVELMAKKLLVEETQEGCRRTALAEEIRSSHAYEMIMIDEFQDVNNLQELIFRALSDSDDLEIMGKNVFVVGDVKQAIYKFRLSNPELFKQTLCAAKEEKNSDRLEAIYLKKNFRSRKEVIDFSNFLFGNIMSAKCGSVEYTDDEKLDPGASYSDRSCPVEVMLIDGHDDFDKSAGYSEENLIVAQRIKKLIDDKQPVFDNGADRPCRPSDICVLAFTNKEIRAMTKALETVGLRAYSEDTDGYLKSREISLTLDILRIVDNPMNDIAMTAVMMSPVLNFSADDIAAVRMKCAVKGSREKKHIYQILSACSGSGKDGEKADMGSQALTEKCREAYKLADGLRSCSMSMGLERLIRRIYEETDLMGITSVYLDSEKKRANLRLLLEYAGSYERNSSDGVTGFLRYIDSVSEKDNAFQQAVSVTEGGESVYIKTYHASKGLEFPFVFLCQLSAPLISPQNAPSIYLHNSLGFGFEFSERSKCVKKKNLYWERLKAECIQEDKSERMRLLYVGCTRAKEKLFVSYALRSDKRTTFEKEKDKMRALVCGLENSPVIPPEKVISQENMLSWITIALAKYPGNEEFENWLGCDTSLVPKDTSVPGGSVEFRQWSAERTEEEKAEKEEKAQTADIELVKKLRRRYADVYDRTLSQLPSKLTVTEITEAEKEKALKGKNPEFYPNLPRLNDELDKLTAAERGTFTHKFMELADYSKAEISVREELDRLVKKGFFTKKEASGVYVDKLESFFGGDFYKRMKSSPDLRREQKFLVSMGDLDLPPELKSVTGSGGMIQGIADCIFKEDGGWVLVDYKTDNFRSRQDMTKYGTQLALYKAAFELIFGERVKGSYIYSFKLGEGVEFEL